MLRGRQRKNEWKKLMKIFESTCKEFKEASSSLVCNTRFADLSWSCKRQIFSKVVAALKYTGECEEQERNCKRFIQCKLVDKSWKYWIGRSVSGKEMRKNVIDIDI